MFILAHLHSIVFIPVAVLALVALLAAATALFTERRGNVRAPSRARNFRPVLVHDRSRPVLVRTRGGNKTRTGVPVRMIYNGG